MYLTVPQTSSLPVVKIFVHDCHRQQFGEEYVKTQRSAVFLCGLCTDEKRLELIIP
jgi:hypothetical protein